VDLFGTIGYKGTANKRLTGNGWAVMWNRILQTASNDIQEIHVPEGDTFWSATRQGRSAGGWLRANWYMKL
jgi:hypothetical protein